MFRWYEYWLKGVDNGIMDEPAVSVFVEGSREVVTADQWPPKDVEYRPLYLRPRHKLSAEPELMGPEHAAPDGFYQAPLTVTDKVEVVSWSTEPFAGADRADRRRRRAPVRRDRPAGHQLHPAAVGRRARRAGAS